MAIPRALIVEDSAAWQQLLAEILEDAGLEVDVAARGTDAERIIRSRSHRVAVIDLSLAGRDHRNQEGLAVLATIQRHDPGCQAIMLTGYATVNVTVTALRELGAVTLLEKNRFSRRAFRQLVQDLLATPPSDVFAPFPPARPTFPSTMGPGRGHLLVVEDDAGWRSLLAELITEAGMTPVQAASYGQARVLLRDGTFILAVVDIALANTQSPTNEDGLRLLAHLQSQGIPFILVSGMASPEIVDRILDQYHPLAFFEKQAFDRRAFQAALQSLPLSSPSPLDILSPREREVLELLVQGKSNKAIAEILVISPNTVKRHLQSIFTKLGVNSRSAAVALVLGQTQL